VSLKRLAIAEGAAGIDLASVLMVGSYVPAFEGAMEPAPMTDEESHQAQEKHQQASQKAS